jgi:hypothetical protein
MTIIKKAIMIQGEKHKARVVREIVNNHNKSLTSIRKKKVHYTELVPRKKPTKKPTLKKTPPKKKKTRKKGLFG